MKPADLGAIRTAELVAWVSKSRRDSESLLDAAERIILKALLYDDRGKRRDFREVGRLLSFEGTDAAVAMVARRRAIKHGLHEARSYYR